MESTIVATEKSTHQIETFVLAALKTHPNADTLSLITIGDTDYSYAGKTDDWKERVGQTVAWIPPDSLVDVRLPEFNFLAAEAKYDENSQPDKTGCYARIKAKKLRGVVSYGLLVPYHGQNLDIKHYEPPVDVGGAKNQLTGGDVAKAPSGVFPKYDVDAFLKYGKKMFVEGEPVFITEKIHGANARYVYKDGVMHCGSRTEWKKEFTAPPNLTLEDLILRIGDEARAKEVYEKVVLNHKPKKNMWWEAFSVTPGLHLFCQSNPGYAVYGEVYGQVQKGFHYGVKNGVAFRAFDILTPEGRWMDAEEFVNTCEYVGIPYVPILEKNFPFNFDAVSKMCEGNTLVDNAGHIREGVVVSPMKERWDARLGRVKLKIINPAYLEK
jgi:RNA ligase (TIGR02306 family)